MAKISATAYLRMRLISEYIWYNSDLPTIVPRKYAYADDLTIMHADGDWRAVKGVLSKVSDNCRRIPPDLEAKAQYYKNGVGSLPP